MQERIKIKHGGERGWASIVKSAFNPEEHEIYEEGKSDDPLPPRGEIEEAAIALGVEFKANIGDEKLHERVTSAMEDLRNRAVAADVVITDDMGIEDLRAAVEAAESPE